MEDKKIWTRNDAILVYLLLITTMTDNSKEDSFFVKKATSLILISFHLL